MRKCSLFLCALMIAGFGFAADQQSKVFTVTTGTNNNGLCSVTNASIRGWIDTIDFDVVTPTTTTGTLSFVVVRELSTLSDVTLAVSTNATADISFRPRFDATGPGGTDLTGDPPLPFLSVGDTLVFSVTNQSAASTTFKALLKYIKQ